MKFAMIFLVLTLVVLMAEPGEGFFKGLRGMWRAARQAWKDYKYNRAMQNQASGNLQQGAYANPPPGQGAEGQPPAYKH